MIEITTSISINVNADWERVFIEEEWIIWFLENINYQKRALDGKTFFFFFNRDRRQRRQIHVERVLPSLPGFVRSGDSAEIPHVTATIGFGVGVNDLAIKTGPRNADAILVTHYRRGIYDEDDHLTLARLTHPRDHAVFGIVKIDPLEPLIGIVLVPQRRL